MQERIYGKVKWTGNPEEDALLATLAWTKSARPNQLLNLNKSYGYLLMAGRGFGKSQVLSASAFQAAWGLPNARIGIVARTSTDARQVLFFGDSGLENNIPKSCIQNITMKPLIIELVNGSTFYGYSAEEPKGLRGPNFHMVFCVAKGTLIAMGDGTEKPIEYVAPEDLVMTRKGPKKVIAQAKTNPSAEVIKITSSSGGTVLCTTNHPFCVGEDRRWVAAGDLQRGDIVWCLSRTGGRSGTETLNSVPESAPALFMDTLESIKNFPQRTEVYDIQVEDCHEFFANGILVHNCDELAFWSGLGSELDDPFEMIQMATRLPSPYRTKIVAATTPDDVDLMFTLETDPDYTKVYGSTYENVDNLDENFLKKIAKKEGTLLGDMELHGKLRRRGGSNLFAPEWFRMWPYGKPWPQFQHVVQSWDTALTVSSTSDFTAGTTWGVFHDKDTGPGIMLIDAFQDRLTFPQLMSKMRAEYSTAKGPNGNVFVNEFLVEYQGSGISLVQQLEGSHIPIVPLSTNAQSKYSRAAAVSYLAEKGLIWVPEGPTPGEVDDWAVPWFEQMIKFSGSERAIKTQKDDYVDSTSGAWNYLDGNGFGRYAVDTRGRRGVSSGGRSPWKNPYLL